MDLAAGLRRRLMGAMARQGVVMLGLRGGGFQPMRALLPPAPPDHWAEVWFLSDPDSGLAKALRAGGPDHPATLVFVAEGHDLHACLDGTLRRVDNRQGLERVWTPEAEVAFPGGSGGIDRAALRMVLTGGTVWAAEPAGAARGCGIGFDGGAGGPFGGNPYL